MDIVEKWMDIPQYNGMYQVSTLGRIWSVKKQKLLKLCINKNGYYKIRLVRPNGKRQEERVHRLVALTFIPNPEHYPVINHKNEIKTDNRVENLEWCTVKYNTQYSSHKIREACKNNHDFESMQVFDNNTGIVYKSIRDAERQTKISRYLIKTTDRFIISEKGGFRHVSAAIE